MEDDGATSSRGKRPAVSSSGTIPEQADVAETDAHASESQAHVAGIDGASGAVAPTVVAKTPPPT